METLGKIAVVCLMVASSSAHDPLVVTTSSGKVRGYRAASRSGREFMAFSGVPYAKPPVGKLRFQPPVELESWSGVRNATEPGPFCLQFTTFEEVKEPLGNEDCLYLSVYTHSTRGRAAVMVHIHGGGFHMGNGERWTEPHFLMDQDVVVVDVNYRLTYLGFLCFEDKEMPGNQGLKDQVMALKWVQKNIAKFGGDPKKVTIFGESAGAGSVYLHTVSPLSRGLFHRAIGESGAGYNPWSLAPPGFARSKAMQLTKNIGCPTTSTSAAVSCLMSKNGSEIVARYQDVVEWQIDMDIIFPCLEPEGHGAFVTGPISRWQHQPVPMILGFASGEGLIRTDYFILENTDFQWLNKNFPRLAPSTLWYKATASNPAEVTKKVLNYYFPGGEITPDLWFNLTQVYSDSWFTAGIIDGANYHTGEVYMYCFDYIGEYTYDEKRSNRTIYFAPAHIEEVEFLWQRPWARNRTLNREDLTLSQTMVKLWTDFAKYGNPTPRDSKLSWKKWNPATHSYFHISNSGLQSKKGLAMDRYKFWKTTNYRDNFK